MTTTRRMSALRGELFTLVILPSGDRRNGDAGKSDLRLTVTTRPGAERQRTSTKIIAADGADRLEVLRARSGWD